MSERHEEVGVDQGRHQRGEVVVVADLISSTATGPFRDHREHLKPRSVISVFRAFR
jgi:hypothetical protein